MDNDGWPERAAWPVKRGRFSLMYRWTTCTASFGLLAFVLFAAGVLPGPRSGFVGGSDGRPPLGPLDGVGATPQRVLSLSPVTGVAVAREGGARLASDPGGEARVRLHEGIALGFQRRSGGWLEVTTTCDEQAWVKESDVIVTPRVRSSPVAPGFDLREAVVVIDAGHGGPDSGAVGPTGLTESSVNLDIAIRLRALMGGWRYVSWHAGMAPLGRVVPAFRAVFLTRDPNGPSGGDYHVSLGYRAALASAAGAHAFVSINNNAGQTTPRGTPGTEVYYAVSVPDSDRLGALN